MQHFVTEMWTFLLQNGAIEGYGTGALWDLYNRSNKPILQIPQFIRQLSHNAPFCNRHLHISLKKNGATWNICLVHCGRCEMGLYMIFSQHCRYWWHGASATEHQEKHCWLHTHAFSALYVTKQGQYAIIILNRSDVLAQGQGHAKIFSL